MDIIGSMSLRDIWNERAIKYGDKPALIFEDCCGNTREYSYAELYSMINKAANLFLSLGINKGDKVALQINNSPEFVMAWFGLTNIGAIVVPINTQFTQRECEYIIDGCGVVAVVIEAAFLPAYQSLRGRNGSTIRHIVLVRPQGAIPPATVHFEQCLRQQPAILAQCQPLNSDDTAEIIFTSGTTSRPKGVVITHCNLQFAGKFAAWQDKIDENDRFLTTMPNFHVDFQCSASMPTFMSGATLIMIEKYSARNFWHQICTYRATITQSMPFILRTLMLQPIKAWEKNHCLRDMLFFLNITDEEKAHFETRFNVTLLNSYGLTETLIGLIGDCPDETRHYPAIGRPGLSFEAKIIDKNGNTLPPNKIGEIYIKGVPGRTILKEYYNNPQATKKMLSEDGWLHTDDKGYVDEHGLFYFVDREINIIKRSGEKIASTEVESILETYPDIAEAAVIGVPDAIRDEAVKAYIIPRDGASLSNEEILAYCETRMARFKIPTAIEFVTALPRTCTGKVDKKQLRIMAGSVPG